MKVLKRDKVIELLKAGETMDLTMWGGYKYDIGFKGTVNINTAHWLINNKLVELMPQGQSPLIRCYRWKGNSSNA